MTITTAELTAMRDLADDHFPDTCTIRRATQSQDAQGGITLEYTNYATDVVCRLDEPKTGAAETMIDSAVGTAVKRIMHLKYDQDVTVKDRIVYSGTTYEVAEVLDSASWLITRRLIVTKVE